MANQKEYPGFPKHFVKDGEPSGRVANTPTDEVNLRARGYKEFVEVAPAEEPKAPEASTAPVDNDSNTAPRPGRPTNPNRPQN